MAANPPALIVDQTAAVLGLQQLKPCPPLVSPTAARACSDPGTGEQGLGQ